MPCQKNHKSWWSPQKKRVAPLESLTPKLISRSGVSMRFLFGAGLKSASIQIEVFLEKLQPFYTFWCELNSEMIWKMTWYSYVTVQICTLYISIIKGYGHLKRSNKTSQELAQLDQVLPRWCLVRKLQCISLHAPIGDSFDEKLH